MTINKAIEILKSYKTYTFTSEENYKESISVDEIIELLQKPTRVGKWIPVSERLPKLGHRVLFKMWNNDVYIGILLKLNDGLKITLEPTGIEYVYSFENVIAWMSLPE